MGPEELKQKVEEETALNYISICSKNPLNGILRLHLPPNNTKMNVFLFPSSSSKGDDASILKQQRGPRPNTFGFCYCVFR
ncbi:hypothetical protein DY000_02025759 [Brassica cretica]|uniref:SHSP domain-containing protein n=1 Tax=Brassica cretica TaxID=69181 RepID=A0ABQ7E9N4_BRACR|nr:hypothetical protein DY000_02025759 [Brassica cretica]